MDEAIEAVGKVDTLTREGVRQQFEQRFTAPIMAKHYVDIYKKLMQAQMRSVKAA
jgi:hypothetical protein